MFAGVQMNIFFLGTRKARIIFLSCTLSLLREATFVERCDHPSRGWCAAYIYIYITESFHLHIITRNSSATLIPCPDSLALDLHGSTEHNHQSFHNEYCHPADGKLAMRSCLADCC
ncbi:hypothetical protein BC832DRAFT_563514 [Gaertneriomyces semiglobifer]|nr:hypothetical protein BC832DRAFT_563514 [Gaertneriomyces semiglobifer]